jgi:hypothetical protein
VKRLAFIGLACGLVAVPSLARAGEMDPALGRLKIVGGEAGCTADPATGYCPDDYLFERMVAELGVSLAPVLNAPARTVGPRGFQFGLDSTVTTISGSEPFWSKGTEGQGGAPLNANPMGVMVWNRLGVRKGLPFGFEVGGSAAHAVNSSMFALGLELKWALLEGFHSGAGSFPDLAVRAAVNRQLGSDQLSTTVASFDVIMSKPFVLGSSWIVSPLLAMQTLLVRAESSVIDLTPEVNAFAECQPLPGHQPLPPDGGPGATVVCTGDGSDFENNAVFEPVSQTRLRLVLGGEVVHEWFVAGTSLAFDLLAPTVTAPVIGNRDPHHARLFAFNLSVGARY